MAAKGFVLTDPRRENDNTIRVAVLDDSGADELMKDMEQRIYRVFHEYITRLESTTAELVLYIKKNVDFQALAQRLDTFIGNLVGNYERQHAPAAA